MDAESGIMEQLTQPRPEEERRELLDRLGIIIRMFSGKKKVEVITEIPPEHLVGLLAKGTDPQTVWFATAEYDRKTGERIKDIVRVPPELLESEVVAKGKAAHEGVHLRVTRYNEFVPEEVMQQLGFAGLMAAAEERPTDQGVRKYFEPATEWIDTARRDSVGEEKPEQVLQTFAIPRYSQLCNLIVYEPHFTPERKAQYSREVLDVFDSVKDAIEKMEHTLPDEKADEDMVMKKAIERYKIIFKEIWPKVKGLMEADKNDKELQKLCDQHKQTVLENLTSEQKELLEQMMLDKIREALQKIFDGLSSSDKKKIQKEVKVEMEDEEDRLVKIFSGELLDNKGETHKEFRQRLERESKAAESKKRIQTLNRTVTKREASPGKGGLAEYNKAFAEVQEQVDALYYRLDQIFHPNIDRSSTLRATGSRPSLPQVFRRTAARAAGAKEIPTRIFERKTNPEVRDYAFAIGIDISDSMSTRMQQVLRTGVVLGEGLSREQLPCLLFGFGENIQEYKPFDQRLSDIHREKMGNMKNGLEGSTYTNKAILFGSQELQKIQASQKFLILLTDGSPSVSIKDALKSFAIQEDQHLVAVGLGPSTDKVASLFPHGIPNVKDNDLVPLLSDLLENMVLSPEDYI